ncbi:MAG TPA: hypothetical protein PLQ97_12740 [Myxococcota bacterium]|nr:hypothetical protein [Myxococcota bacterium]HQK52056.1 hypothetical protein [Myxococcota bacterium]
MELICLNCLGEFEPDGTLPASGGPLKCPRCGAEQVFHPAGGRPLPRMSAPSGTRESVSEGTGGAFRKPQSLAIRKGATPGSSGESGNSPRTGPVPHVRRDTDSIPPIRASVSGAVEVVPPPPASAAVRDPGSPEGPDGAAVSANEDSGQEWMVKSPTGLVLEFSSPALLVAWSAVVDNPAPYQVCRAGGDWKPLDAFLQEIKRGGRPTQAFRAPTSPGRGSSGAIPTVSGAMGGDGAADVSSSESSVSPQPRTPTTGFTFKVANTSKPPSRGWLKPLLWALFVGAAGVGGYFLWLFTK